MERSSQLTQHSREEAPDSTELLPSIRNPDAQARNQPDRIHSHADASSDHEETALNTEDSLSTEDQRPSNNLKMSVPAEKTQHHHLSLRSRKFRSEQLWIAELLSLFLAFASFAAIVAVLRVFDGAVQPNWRHNISINAVIAVLATSLRAFLVVISQEVISQFKWLWFKLSRPAIHMEYFDEASRGPWGSFLLFFRVPRLNVPSIGGFILVISIAISVFAQQAIRPVPLRNTTAQLPYFGHNPGIDIDPTVKINIINALTNPSANRTVSPKGCSTGNCTFNSVEGITHSFAGVCSRCVDTSPEIFLWSNSNVTAPGALLYINATGGQPSILVNSYDTLRSVAGAAFSGSFELPSNPALETVLPSSLLNTSILSLTLNGCTLNGTANNQDPEVSTAKCSPNFASIPNGLDLTALVSQNSNWSQLYEWNVLSASCVLYPCIRNSFADVVNGTFTETTINEVVMVPQYDFDTPYPTYVAVNDPCIIDGLLYGPSNYSAIPPWYPQNQTIYGQTVPNTCVYSFKGTTVIALPPYLSDIFNANCSMYQYYDTNLFDQQWALCSTETASSGQANAIWFQSMFSLGNSTFQIINSSISSMATAISDSIRLQGAYGSIYNVYTGDGAGAGFPDAYGNASMPTILYGSVFQTDVCVQVNWGWLALPAALLVLTAILLLDTIIRGLFDKQQYPIWKSSILPLLYATSETDITATDSNLTIIEEDATKRRIQLINDEGKWAFVRN